MSNFDPLDEKDDRALSYCLELTATALLFFFIGLQVGAYFEAKSHEVRPISPLSEDIPHYPEVYISEEEAEHLQRILSGEH